VAMNTIIITTQILYRTICCDLLLSSDIIHDFFLVGNNFHA
jgi:hypothetical protein